MERVGLELTFIPQVMNVPHVFMDWMDDCHAKQGIVCIDADGLGAFANAIENRLVQKRIGFMECGTDPAVVEVSTNPLNYKDIMKNIAAIMDTVSTLINWEAHTPYLTGGGAQVSLDAYTATYEGSDEYCRATVVKNDNYNKNAMMVNIFNHVPSVVWAFAHPASGNVRGNNTSFQFRGRDYSRKFILDEDKDQYVCPHGVSERSFYGNDPREGRIEFRFFPMTKNIDQHKEHIDFALAVKKHISENLATMMEKFPIEMVKRKPKTIDLATALKEYKDFILMLGLDWSVYRKYTKNIKTRYAYADKYGKKYLV